MADERAWLSEYACELKAHNPEGEFDLPLTVYPEDSNSQRTPFESEQFYDQPVSSMLDVCRCNVLLLGTPGAGKSYQLRAHLARSGQYLLKEKVRPLEGSHWSVGDQFSIPIFVDLKLYQGGLANTFQPLFESVQLQELIESGEAGFVVDSFNEAPEQFRLNGRLEEDLMGWISKTPNCRWIIASRDDEGLEFFDAQSFRLSNLDYEFTKGFLESKQINLEGVHGKDLMFLLRTPFYMSALLSERLVIESGDMHPAEAIQTVLQSYEREVEQRVGREVDLAASLSDLAVQAVTAGEEILARQNVEACFPDYSEPAKVVSGMLQSGLLVEYSKEEVSFYHQSITEFMAAQGIARQLQAEPNRINFYRQQTRWDETLHLAMYYLDEESSRQVVRHLFAKDITLATKLVRACVRSRDRLVDEVLELSLHVKQSDNHRYHNEIVHLPVKQKHRANLRKLAERGSSLGGVALRHLTQLATSDEAEPSALRDHIQFVIELVQRRPTDYNLGQDAGGLLKAHVDESDVEPILKAFLNTTPPPANYENNGVIRFVAEVLEDQDVQTVIHHYRAIADGHPDLLKAISEWASQNKDHELAMRLLFELVIEGSSTAVFQLGLAMMFNESEYDELWMQFDSVQREAFKGQLKEVMKSGDDVASFTVDLIHSLSRSIPDMAEWRESLVKGRGAQSVALLARFPGREELYWKRFKALVGNGKPKLAEHEYELLKSVRPRPFNPGPDWTSERQFMIDLLEAGNVRLLASVITRETFANVAFPWKWIQTWIGWMHKASEIENHFFAYEFLPFLMNHTNEKFVEEMIAEFNRPDSKYRAELGDWFLPALDGLQESQFTDESIQYLIKELHKPRANLRSLLLGKVLQEETITNQLVPMLESADETLRDNLKQVLEDAGSRLGKRFT